MTEDKTKKEERNNALDAEKNEGKNDVVDESNDSVEDDKEISENEETNETVIKADKESMETNNDAREVPGDTKEGDELKTNEKVSINKIVIAIIATAVLVAAVVMFSGKTPTDGEALTSNAIATVNGEQILESDVSAQLSQVEAAYVAQGQVITDEIRSQMRADTIDALIVQRLIMQEAERLGIVVTDEDVNNTYTNELLPVYGGEEALTEILASAGVTKEEVLADVRQQLIMERFIETVVDESLIETSDEDARALYDATALTTENLPPFEEVIDDVKASLYEQAENEQIIAIVDELRAEAEVVVN